MAAATTEAVESNTTEGGNGVSNGIFPIRVSFPRGNFIKPSPLKLEVEESEVEHINHHPPLNMWQVGVMPNMSGSSAPIQVDDENQHESTPTQSSTKRSRTSSNVWESFTKLPVVKGNIPKAECKYCKQIYTCKPSGGTSHLLRHLPKCPKSRNRGSAQYTISHDTSTTGTSLKSCKVDAEAIRREIALMIVSDEQPFRFVEDVGFRRVMAAACPEFKVLNRKTVKRDIISIYEKEKENVIDLLRKCQGRICLTCDTWKSVTDDHYIVITAHFVDLDWVLQRRIIHFKLIPPPCDALSIGDEIISCITHWNIEHRMFSITLDNVSMNDCVATMLKRRLNAKKYLPCDGVFFHIRCCADILNLVVQAGFDLIPETIGKLRHGVKYVKQSPHRKKNFFSISKNLNLDVRKNLVLDCPTRWNSIYNMLEVSLHYKAAFLHLGERDGNFKHNLVEEEWEKVSILCKFLKPFYEVTCMFSGVKYPTSNLYFKGVWKIHMNFLAVVMAQENFLTPMVCEMQKKFSKYWSEYNKVFSCAVVLDPRCKTKFIDYCYTKLYGGDAEQHVSTVVNTLICLFDEYKKDHMHTSSSNASGISFGATNIVNMEDDFADFMTFQSQRFMPRFEKSQLELYLEEPNLDLNMELDILEFWRSRSNKFPLLSRMARDILTIPVSTVVSECAFSNERRVISPFRSSLKSNTIQALICLQDWMRPNGKECNLDAKSQEDNSSSEEDDDY